MERDHHRIQHHQLPRVRLVVDRDQFIVDRCRDKRVLHLGCIGDINRFGTGTSLHGRIAKAAMAVIGIDISRDAVEALHAQGVSNLIHGDIQELDRLHIGVPIHVIVAGEVLEHLPNPGRCLEGISALLRNGGGEAIITVPNAFSLRGIVAVLLHHRELVRSDHHFYFSYVTLSALLTRHGLSPVEWFTYSNLHARARGLRKFVKIVLNLTIFRILPFTAEGLIVVVRSTKEKAKHDT